ncbi:hypothetical protein [Pseudoalteromonas sp.]|uniref:hypothetical protein n=1 Tax=Pseudoalteromonas sp. TaxID=53249 RepID=UPI003561ADFB
MRVLLVVLFSIFSFACSDSSTPSKTFEPIGDKVSEQVEPKSNVQVPNNQSLSAYRIAITGNSHVSGLGGVVSSIIKQMSDEKTAESQMIGHGFLDVSFKSTSSLEALANDNWSHIILQGQKYSQSRTTNYSTTGAQRWIARAKDAGVTPILFPEHPQRGDDTEAKYVYGLHQVITAQQASCIAPVGLVWDRVLQLMPQIELHATDGNHASALGKYLTALVFAEVITGLRIDSVTLDPVSGLLPDEQLLMAQAVSEIIFQHPACPF